LCYYARGFGYIPNACPPASQKWCHIVCTMNGRRELLKIPATARFCERSILTAPGLSNWTVAAASVTPSRIRVLVRTPTAVTRKQILRTVKKVAAAAMRRAGAMPRWFEPLWGERSWCLVIRSQTALVAIHHHMTAPNGKSGTRRLPASSAASAESVRISVGEEPTRGVHNVHHLGQHEILKGRSVR
jgi:REP element-mobilizing transposase RayT